MFFSKVGIETVTPDEEEMQYIGEKIESEPELGIINPGTRKKFLSIAEKSVCGNKAFSTIY